jgi:glycosyltransferase involved in cell wall biosynthesis
MTPKRLKVLVSAYACEPNAGSEPGVGWNISFGLANRHDVWVLTRANNKQAIEAEMRKHPGHNINFIYHDLPRWARFWKKGRRGIFLYYYLWQIFAARVVRAAHERVCFDIAHHVTFARYWGPSCLVRLPIPFVWGPLGGGEDAPIAFWPELGIRGILYEMTRMLARRICHFDPLIRLVAKRSALALATANGTRLHLEMLKPQRIDMMSEVAFGDSAVDLKYLLDIGKVSTTTTRFISVGNLIPLKGYRLGLKAFARANIPNSQYWLIGEGTDRGRLQQLAKNLGIGERVRFLGAQPRAKVLELLSESDIFVHPSLHDSGGWACLEAMAAAKPVLCLSLGGPATQVTPETGFLCTPSFPTVAVYQMAEAMKRLATDPSLQKAMGEAGRQRIKEKYLMAQRVEYFSQCYQQILS